jgi:Zn finger protein HypA/HybF involved in hydrogenase expression
MTKQKSTGAIQFDYCCKKCWHMWKSPTRVYVCPKCGSSNLDVDYYRTGG